jgi:hypothetical protein
VTILRILAALVAAGAVALPEAAGAAARLAWDQAKVTEIAQELPKAAEDLRGALRREPAPAAGGVGGRRYYWQLTDIVRRIERESQHLARALKSGQGHDQTLPVMENLAMLVRDAREKAQRIFRTESIVKAIEAGRAVLDRLTPYYDMEPLPPPLTRNAP